MTVQYSLPNYQQEEAVGINRPLSYPPPPPTHHTEHLILRVLKQRVKGTHADFPPLSIWLQEKN
jgi:hypothetical protein